ncbi:hypothetical protein C8Q80DRAFT_1271359 [Daedaleopsis nitida]|nr:hypothetical protein C8Q80DRAFT_1271359 [Daedaleopsis nitida]
MAEPIDDDGCEVLYGRAGLLHASPHLRSELVITISSLSHAGKPKEKVCETKSSTSESRVPAYTEELEGTERLNVPLLMVDMVWFAAAPHGVAGILHVLLHAPSEIIKPHREKILGTV